jgi:fructan beta-fructosidase
MSKLVLRWEILTQKNWRSAALPHLSSLEKINDQYIVKSTPVKQFKKQGTFGMQR